MGESRGRFEWRQTAAILATLANVNRSPSTPEFRIDDFDPYASREVQKVGIEALKVFLPRQT